MNSCIIPNEPQDPYPLIFESLDANVIRAAALRVNGAAGPSGLDSHEWRRLCTSHKGASRDLCASLASVATRISTSYVHPSSLAPLLACRSPHHTQQTSWSSSNRHWRHGSPYHCKSCPFHHTGRYPGCIRLPADVRWTDFRD